MASVASPSVSIDATENPFIFVLNKRIRAYKKKVERINALKDKQNLDKDQIELCSRFDLYNTILGELLSMKEQMVAIVKSSTSAADEMTPAVECGEEVSTPEESPVVAVECDEEVSTPEGSPVVAVECGEEVSTPEGSPVVAVEVASEEKQTEEVEGGESNELVDPVDPVDPMKSEKQEGQKKNQKPRKYYRSRKDDNRSRYPRNKNNYRKKFAGKKDEDGWEIPKKVVYIKQDRQ